VADDSAQGIERLVTELDANVQALRKDRIGPRRPAKEAAEGDDLV
jgi:hypothetical protein